MLDVIKTKKCKDCGEVKPIDQFNKAGKNKKTGKQYYDSNCRECRKEYNKEYNNRPEVKVRKREYDKEYSQRPEVKEHKKEYYNRPEVKEHKKEYYREYNNRPEVREHKKEYYREYNNRPEAKQSARKRNRIHNQHQRAIRYGAPYSPDISDQYNTTKEMLGGSCAYCQVELNTENEHWEHIIPLSREGAHTPDNIVCSCASCNISKYNRPMEEWYREQPFFSEERLQQIYAIRDYWNAVGFEVVYPTEDQVNEAIQIAEGALGTIQNLSRIQRDPHVIQDYI